jgi:hypothetical protein
MNPLSKCILTGFFFGDQVEFLPSQDNSIRYKFKPVGIVNVSNYVLESIKVKPIPKPWILAGICRYAFVNNSEPPILTTNFIDNFLNTVEYPKNFKEKAFVLLKYIYDSGGNDYRPVNLFAIEDFPLAFAEDPKEFNRLMDYIEEHGFMTCKNKVNSLGDFSNYYDILLTDDGIAEIEKDKPNIPMIGLAIQEIHTGNPQLDIKIDHAKKLFFKSNSSKEDKRSACESLSFALEPLREELKSFLSTSDVSDFFNIVNNFDIRHNKDHTKRLEHDEQLEWVFYALLNTINTYSKLKNKK